MFLRSLVILGLSLTLLSCSGADATPEVATQPTITLNNYTHSAFEVELLEKHRF